MATENELKEFQRACLCGSVRFEVKLWVFNSSCQEKWQMAKYSRRDT